MHSFATLTAITATLATIANGVPLAHGPKHAHLHAARALNINAESEIVKLAPVIAKRSIVPTVNLDVYGGTCGGSTGFGCAEGFCCSTWGYCGQGPLYCGDAPALNGTAPALNGTAPLATGGATHSVSIAGKGPPGYGWGHPHSWGAPAPSSSDNGLPAYTPATSAPAYSSPPETSAAAAPATSSQAPAPAPSSYAPAPSSEAPAPAPSSYAPAPSSAAPAPSSEATAPSSYAPAPSSAPAAPSSAAPAPSSAAPAPSSYEPQPSTPASSGGGGLGDVYKMYSGSGAPSAGWPSEDQWASFDDAWSSNVPTIKISCSQFGQEDPSDQEVADTKSAIESVASESGVDSRFILAIMMQESKGCVRVPTTAYSHENPGLFQSFQGTGTCNPDGTGVVPCPASTIKQMVSDGVSGTASGPGLKQNMAECSATGSQKYYEAARIYNAGSIPSDGDLGAAGATQCYCSDVANRLTGWTTSDSGCTLG